MLKRLAIRTLTAPAMGHLFWPLLRDRASIFMLHRFRMPDLGIEGHDPAELARSLEELRRRRYDLVDLATLFRALAAGEPFARPTVAFTIDDGYLDQAMAGAPVFAQYDCPVTTFVTTGFLDGRLWFWWDRIAFAFRHTARPAVELPLGDARLRYAWTDADQRLAAQTDFTERCKTVPDGVKLAAIEHLAAALEVELPAAPPAAYAPMTWDVVRQCEQRGMAFGPHTVTHPVLSHTSDEQSRDELTTGWARLRAEAARPVPVFCYPNGQTSDFGSRETDTLASLGFVGAVIGEYGYADARRFQNPGEPFRVRRFAYTGDRGAMLQSVSGVDRAKQLIRRQA